MGTFARARKLRDDSPGDGAGSISVNGRPWALTGQAYERKDPPHLGDDADAVRSLRALWAVMRELGCSYRQLGRLCGLSAVAIHKSLRRIEPQHRDYVGTIVRGRGLHGLDPDDDQARTVFLLALREINRRIGAIWRQLADRLDVRADDLRRSAERAHEVTGETTWDFVARHARWPVDPGFIMHDDFDQGLAPWSPDDPD